MTWWQTWCTRESTAKARCVFTSIGRWRTRGTKCRYAWRWCGRGVAGHPSVRCSDAWQTHFDLIMVRSTCSRRTCGSSMCCPKWWLCRRRTCKSTSCGASEWRWRSQSAPLSFCHRTGRRIHEHDIISHASWHAFTCKRGQIERCASKRAHGQSIRTRRLTQRGSRSPGPRPPQAARRLPAERCRAGRAPCYCLLRCPAPVSKAWPRKMRNPWT